MTKKVKAKSRILKAVHETASDLHRLGFIDKRKMREIDALCLATKVPEYDANKGVKSALDSCENAGIKRGT